MEVQQLMLPDIHPHGTAKKHAHGIRFLSSAKTEKGERGSAREREREGERERQRERDRIRISSVCVYIYINIHEIYVSKTTSMQQNVLKRVLHTHIHIYTQYIYTLTGKQGHQKLKLPRCKPENLSKAQTRDTEHDVQRVLYSKPKRHSNLFLSV